MTRSYQSAYSASRGRIGEAVVAAVKVTSRFAFCMSMVFTTS